MVIVFISKKFNHFVGNDSTIFDMLFQSIK